MLFGSRVAVKRSVFNAAVAIVLLAGCGGGKAGAGNYKLKVSVNPANGGSISINPNMESYNEWMDVNVTATAAKGYEFEGWSGDATEKSKSVTIKMSGNKNKKLTANFKAVPTFTDNRDGKKYTKITVGGQTWMGENLNYAAEGSKCYENNAGNCEKYGRLYKWEAAKKACPSGWHLPSYEEWTTLTDNVGGEDVAGKKLKSTTGWDSNGNGTDDYGFAALPGGFGDSDGDFYGAGGYGGWWSATEQNAGDAWTRDMDDEDEEMGRSGYVKSRLFSVRCVQDVEGIIEKSAVGAPTTSEEAKRVAEKEQIKAERMGGELPGGRSRASIQRVVMQNMAAISYAFNRRLREKPGLNGKIGVKFAINQYGKVISAQVVESTMNDTDFESIVVDKVKSWDFGKIDKPDDVTEVVYPFVFSQ